MSSKSLDERVAALEAQRNAPLIVRMSGFKPDQLFSGRAIQDLHDRLSEAEK